tara:strand:+ start:170 stop:358 length:189 start_codon:yes stop_codon:yes gene_type:complete
MSKKLPILIMTTEQGGTVHKYPLTGGLTEFERYLSCYLGSCQFNNDMDGATKHLANVQPKVD